MEIYKDEVYDLLVNRENVHFQILAKVQDVSLPSASYAVSLLCCLPLMPSPSHTVLLLKTWTETRPANLHGFSYPHFMVPIPVSMGMGFMWVWVWVEIE
jgi:hypothetical protein